MKTYKSEDTLKMFKKSQTVILFSLILNVKSFSIEPIKLVTGNDYPPYSDEKLKNGGMFTEIVIKILNRLDIPFKIEFLPWARGYNMVKNGAFDATFPYTITNERLKDVKFSKISLAETKMYLFVNSKFKNKKNIDDLKGTIYCHPLGYYLENVVKNNLEKKEIKKISKFDELSCINAVINEEADFMVSSDIQMKSYKNQNILFFEKIKKIGNPISFIKLYIIFKKNFDDNLIKKIDEESIIFLKSKEYKKIINSY